MLRTPATALVIAFALAGCGEGRPAPAVTADPAPAEATSEAAEAPDTRSAALDRLDGDASKTGIAALPAEHQAGLRGVAGEIKRELDLRGAQTSGSPDDIACTDWLAAPGDFLEEITDAVYEGLEGNESRFTEETFAEEISSSCATDRGGSALDHFADTVILVLADRYALETRD
ncbi:MAG: hypothetical protein ITG02_01245 [Patulibacter sp.]|nr:hypothetical protein [Patulibacter sp.]